MRAEGDPAAESVPGKALARAFYHEAVAPILADAFPGLLYSAGLLGPGSEVLGYDDPMSTDHHWGPRVMLFLRHRDLEGEGHAIRDTLAARLPPAFRGYPTNWTAPDAEDHGTQKLAPVSSGPVNHRVELLGSDRFFASYLGMVPGSLSARDWLVVPWQKLRSIAAGEFYRDDLDLASVQRSLRWYPDDVWLYVLAACWARIGQEEHLTGRAGFVGDELGSAVIAARIVRDCMRLGFLMERVYPPYAKWLGTAFGELACSRELKPILERVLKASSWETRDTELARAYGHLAWMHNSLGLTEELPVEPEGFWGRPFTVIHGERFAAALIAAIRDPAVKALPGRSPIGSIDLVSDNTDVLEDPVIALNSRHLHPEPGVE